jgi:hypothetical protein
MEQTEGSRPAQVQNDDAGSLLGRKAPNVSKVAIHRHQRTAFAGASLEDALVSHLCQPLLTNSHNVMAILS